MTTPSVKIVGSLVDTKNTHFDDGSFAVVSSETIPRNALILCPLANIEAIEFER